nr:MAG TPA: Cob(I)alamin adenosyltransferase [Caudoviricetes sp.]
MGCKSVEEYNRRMARRKKNLKEMEDNKDGK